MKILAAVVIPPHLQSSGAVNAALALSEATLPYCDIDLAQMAFETAESSQGKLRVLQRGSSNILSFTERFLPNKFRTLFFRSDLASLVQGYDLVHIHNPIPALEMKRVAMACMRNGIPYVITTHGFVETLDLKNSYRLGWMESIVGHYLIFKPIRFVARHASRVFCLSPQDQSLLLKHGVAPERTAVVPNGVKPGYFAEPSEEAIALVRERFQLPKAKSTPVCFFLANHTRNKGLDILLDAFLGSDAPYFLIVGGAKRELDYDGVASRTGPNQRILFTDRLSDEEIRALHHYSDLFVFPTRADTLPLVILEAMASGKPVLSTKVGGIPFQIDARCGRLVEPNDPEAFRAAMEELCQDPSQLVAMGEAARHKVRTQFDWDASAQETVRHYREILATGS